MLERVPECCQRKDDKNEKQRQVHAEEANIFNVFDSFTKRDYCPRCDKTFKDKTGLKRHYQGHTGSFSYWCEICAKGYTVKGNFTDHMARHEGKTFPCSYCHKKFKTNNTLIKHSKEHIH